MQSSAMSYEEKIPALELKGKRHVNNAHAVSISIILPGSVCSLAMGFGDARNAMLDLST